MASIIKCVLCDKEEAVTVAAHIPVCDKHWQEYAAEASQYLPDCDRVFFKKLIKASRRQS